MDSDSRGFVARTISVTKVGAKSILLPNTRHSVVVSSASAAAASASSASHSSSHHLQPLDSAQLWMILLDTTARKHLGAAAHSFRSLCPVEGVECPPDGKIGNNNQLTFEALSHAEAMGYDTRIFPQWQWRELDRLHRWLQGARTDEFMTFDAKLSCFECRNIVGPLRRARDSYFNSWVAACKIDTAWIPALAPFDTSCPAAPVLRRALDRIYLNFIPKCLIETIRERHFQDEQRRNNVNTNNGDGHDTVATASELIASYECPPEVFRFFLINYLNFLFPGVSEAAVEQAALALIEIISAARTSDANANSTISQLPTSCFSFAHVVTLVALLAEPYCFNEKDAANFIERGVNKFLIKSLQPSLGAMVEKFFAERQQAPSIPLSKRRGSSSMPSPPTAARVSLTQDSTAASSFYHPSASVDKVNVHQDNKKQQDPTGERKQEAKEQQALQLATDHACAFEHAAQHSSVGGGGGAGGLTRTNSVVCGQSLLNRRPLSDQNATSVLTESTALHIVPPGTVSVGTTTVTEPGSPLPPLSGQLNTNTFTRVSATRMHSIDAYGATASPLGNVSSGVATFAASPTLPDNVINTTSGSSTSMRVRVRPASWLSSSALNSTRQDPQHLHGEHHANKNVAHERRMHTEDTDNNNSNNSHNIDYPQNPSRQNNHTRIVQHIHPSNPPLPTNTKEEGSNNDNNNNNDNNITQLIRGSDSSFVPHRLAQHHSGTSPHFPPLHNNTNSSSQNASAVCNGLPMVVGAAAISNGMQRGGVIAVGHRNSSTTHTCVPSLPRIPAATSSSSSNLNLLTTSQRRSVGTTPALTATDSPTSPHTLCRGVHVGGVRDTRERESEMSGFNSVFDGFSSVHSYPHSPGRTSAVTPANAYSLSPTAGGTRTSQSGGGFRARLAASISRGALTCDEGDGEGDCSPRSISNSHHLGAQPMPCESAVPIRHQPAPLTVTTAATAMRGSAIISHIIGANNSTNHPFLDAPFANNRWQGSESTSLIRDANVVLTTRKASVTFVPTGGMLPNFTPIVANNSSLNNHSNTTSAQQNNNSYTANTCMSTDSTAGGGGGVGNSASRNSANMAESTRPTAGGGRQPMHTTSSPSMSMNARSGDEEYNGWFSKSHANRTPSPVLGSRN